MGGCVIDRDGWSLIYEALMEKRERAANYREAAPLLEIMEAIGENGNDASAFGVEPNDHS